MIGARPRVSLLLGIFWLSGVLAACGGGDDGAGQKAASGGSSSGGAGGGTASGGAANGGAPPGGGSGGTGATASGGAAGLDPSSIHASWIDDQLTDTGASQTTVDLAGMDLSVLVPDGDGFDEKNGQVQPDGSVVVADVPDGYYYFRLGSDYVVTQARDLDLGEYQIGRSDAVSSTNPATALTLDIAGLHPWQAADDLELISGGAGVFAHIIWAWASNPPGVGATSVKSMSLGWFDKLIDASKGDRTFFTQLVASAGPESTALERVQKAAEIGDLSMSDGSPNPTSSALADVPQTESAALDWRRSAFAALGPRVYASAALLNEELGIAARPGGELGGGLQIMNHLLHVPPTGAATSDVDFGTVSFGNPYPASWGTFSYARATFAVLIPDGSATLYPPSGGNVSIEVGGESFGGPIEPALGPIANLSVAGKSAQGGPVSGVGATPLVEFDAPAEGGATYYVVAVYQKVVSGGGQGSLVNVAALATPQTSVRIPPGVLASGGRYVLMVRAVSMPNTDSEAHPFRASFPRRIADAFSDPIDP